MHYTYIKALHKVLLWIHKKIIYIKNYIKVPLVNINAQH